MEEGVTACDKCEQSKATEECVECGMLFGASGGESRPALLCNPCLTALHGVLGKFAAAHSHVGLGDRQVMSELRRAVSSEIALFQQAVETCTVDAANSLREKTTKSCEELSVGIRTAIAELHKMLTDKEQELIRTIEQTRDHKLTIISQHLEYMYFNTSIAAGSKLVKEIEAQLEAPPTDVPSFQEGVSSQLKELRKLREALLLPRPPQAGPSFPTHPACGFVVDTTMIKQAMGYLVSLHAEELREEDKVMVNVIGSISSKGLFRARVVADEYGTQDLMLQNMSLAIGNELSRSRTTPIPYPQPGQLCCVQYSADQRWYRARVEVVSRPGMASVYFLDYGSNQMIPFSAVYPLAEEFQVYPFQMIQCCLTDDLTISFDKREVRWHFNDHTRDKRVAATILKILGSNVMGPLHLVQLLDTTNPQPFDIGATVLTVAESRPSQTQTHTLKYRDYRYKDQPPVVQLVTSSSTSTPSLLPSSQPREQEEEAASEEVGAVTKAESQPDMSSPPRATEAEETSAQEPNVEGSVSDVSNDVGSEVSNNVQSRELTGKTPEQAEVRQPEASPGDVSDEVATSSTETKLIQEGENGADLPAPGASPKPSENARVEVDGHASSCPSPVPTTVPETVTGEGDAVTACQEATQMQSEATQVKSTTLAVPLPSAAVEKPGTKVKPLKIEMPEPEHEGDPGFLEEDPVAQANGRPVGCLEDKDVMCSLPEAVQIGAELEAFVTSELSEEGTFWVQLQGEGAEVLDQLSERLQEEVSQPKELYTPIFFGEGDYCVALYSEDNQWYRARIERADKRVFSVRFVDFGNAEESRHEHLKLLTSEFRQMPPQALLCSIASNDHPQFTQLERDKFTDTVPVEEAIVAKVIDITDSVVYVQLLLRIEGTDPVDLTDEVYTADVTRIESMDFSLERGSRGWGHGLRKGSFDIPQSPQDHVVDWAEHMDNLNSPHDDGFLTLYGVQGGRGSRKTMPEITEIKPAPVVRDLPDPGPPPSKGPVGATPTSTKSDLPAGASKTGKSGRASSGGSRGGHAPRLDMGTARKTILSNIGGPRERERKGRPTSDRRWETVTRPNRRWESVDRSATGTPPKDHYISSREATPTSSSPAPPDGPRASPGPVSTPKGRKSPEPEEGQVKMYVKYMPHQKTQEEVSELFGEYGTVYLLEYHSEHRDKLYLIMDAEGGKKAMAQLNGLRLRGSPNPLSVQIYKSLAGPSSSPPWQSSSGSLDNIDKHIRLFVKNVPPDTGHDTLTSVLSAYGKVYEIVKHPDRRNVVFVYMDPDGASAAIDALHGKAICKNSQPLIMEVSQEPSSWHSSHSGGPQGRGGGRRRKSSQRTH